MTVEDNIIVLNSGVTGEPSLNSGISIERGTSANAEIRWNETTDTWQISSDSNNYSNVASGSFVANVTAGTGVTISNAGGEAANPTFAIGQSVATNAEVTFAGVKATSVVEALTISATAANGTTAINVSNGTTYYTSDATANFTPNLRWDSNTSMNSKLAVGEMATTTWMVKNGATARFANSVQVDGTTSGVTLRWQGSTGAPTSGNANSIDMYTFTVVKTGNATFDVFAAQTRFA